jgi:hypothetical protein
MSYKYWNDTVCINCDDLNAIEQHITHLLEQEGCHQLHELPKVDDPEQIPYDWELDWPLIIALSKSQIGWTVVNVSPVRFFCERAKGANRPRLSTLAMKLGCDAFYFGVYLSSLGVLLEANAQGQTFVTGAISPDFETFQESFYDERIDSIESVSDFQLLKVPEPLKKAIQANQDTELLSKQAEWDAEEQRQIDEALRLQEENPDLPSVIVVPDNGAYSKGHTERIDEALAEAIGCPNSWGRNRLYGIMYTELPGSGSKALYFQLPDSYQPQHLYADD